MDRFEFTNADYSKQYILNGLSAMPGGFFIYTADEDKKILYANEALLRLFECENEYQFLEHTGGSFKGIVYHEDIGPVEESIIEQVSSDDNHTAQVHYRILTRNGKIKYVENYGRYYDDPVEGPLYYVFVSAAQVRLDNLTHLPNSEYFMELTEEGEKRMAANGKTPVVMAFDLVGMKSFNSKYGHEEGDRLLVEFAEILKNTFTTEHCARFGEDHFYAYTEITNIEEVLNVFIAQLNEINDGRTLAVKIGLFKYDPSISISAQCDRAKIACNVRKGMYGSGYTWFDDQMSQDYMRNEYIISHLDQALAEGWIKIFFQPVVRTLSGKLCNVEALVRWEDPKLGMIPPSEFIPLLEENGISYKVDMYVVRRVTDLLQRRLRSGETIVPVSVNISKADFDSCDPVNLITSAADDRGIRRSFICVEITESALMGNNEVIKKAIERFHDAGIEVWMDDFGSGYSSLNILKDFNFDEIKIDMAFLKNFNEKSKQIIINAIHMAKDLGIHTLAEGVETREQLEFLKSVGCEKLQGYYYGKPQAPVDAITNLRNKGISAETRELAMFYQKTGLVNLVSESPLALMIYNGEEFKIIYENENFSETMEQMGIIGLEDTEICLNHSEYMIGRKFRYLADKAVSSMDTETMLMSFGSRYYNFSFRMVSECRQGSMIVVVIDRTYYDEQRNMTEQNESVMRSLFGVYDSVYLLDFENDVRTVISSNLPYEKNGERIHNIESFYEDYRTRFIYVDDLEEWRQLTSEENFIKRLKFTGRGYFTEVLRVKRADGSYQWTEFLIMSSDGPEGRKYIIGVKPAEIEDVANKTDVADKMLKFYRSDKNDENVGSEGLLWHNFINESNLKIFWKDTNRRFLGASRKFMEYYSFNSFDDFVGKTDEEVGWHVDDSPYKEDELNVIEKGEIILNSPGQNIVDGVMHNMSANKFPIYKNGNIVGLLGYVFDIDEDISNADNNNLGVVTDPLTGLMNSKGIQDTSARLDDNYRTNGEDYTYAVINVDDYRDIQNDYGIKISKKLIKICAERIRNLFDTTVTLARAYGCEFTICDRNICDEKFMERIKDCTERLMAIKEIDGIPCKLHVRYGIAQGSEANSVYEVWELAQNRLSVNNESKADKYSILPDVYNDLPMSCVVCRPVFDESGENVIDAEYEFVNKKYCEIIGLSAEEIIGQNYLQKFPYSSKKWVESVYRSSRGEYVNGRAYDGATNHWLDFTAAPVSVPGSSIVVFTIADSAKEEKDRMTAGHVTDEAIIRIAKILNGKNMYCEALIKALRELNRLITAKRFYIISKDRKTFHVIAQAAMDNSDERLMSKEQNDYKIISQWEKYLESSTSVMIEYPEKIKEEQPDFYKYMVEGNINNFIAVPLYEEDHLMGYLCVEDYEADTPIDKRKLLETISYFIAARITNHKLFDQELRTRIEKDIVAKDWFTDDVGINIARILYSNEQYETAMERVLSELSKIICSDRIFINLINGNEYSRIFEWCADGVESAIDSIQKLSFGSCHSYIEELLKDSDCVLIEDIENLKFSAPELYEQLKNHNTLRTMMSPLYHEGKLIGLIGAENYELEDSIDAQKILETISYFVAFRVANQYFYKMLSGIDSLTGVKNINAIFDMRTNLKEIKVSIGMIYMDIEGLKMVNRKNGREQGDSVLKKVALMLSKCFDKDNVYRTGGDEFTVFLLGITESDFVKKKEDFAEYLRSFSDVKYRIEYKWSESSENIDDLFVN